MSETGLNEQIAARVRQLRAARGLSLEGLAERSGVSRSMISLIERGETSPTAVVLERLAVGLDITLAGLFDPPQGLADPVSRRASQALWRDPDSGYLRRNVSPAGFPTPIQIVEVEFPAGGHVAYETGPRPTLTHQQIWVLEGEMDVTVGEKTWQLQTGDCLAMVLDQRIVFRNPGLEPARYAVALTTLPPTSRRT